MRRTGFEPMISVIEWEEIFHALNSADFVIGWTYFYISLNYTFQLDKSSSELLCDAAWFMTFIQSYFSKVFENKGQQQQQEQYVKYQSVSS
jgi:hypothetical protein